MTITLTGIGSMATRQLVAELGAEFQRRSGNKLVLESVGGVDAARRVTAGEPFDVVLLASDAIDRLIDSGHLRPGSRVDVARSPVAVAVRAGSPRPDIGSDDAVRHAVLAAPSLSCSTGPSGAHLMRLFERWGIGDQVRDKLVQAPPGVPVGSLVARGEVALGFQQLSELMHLDGIEVLGTLPPEIAFVTVFSGAVGARSAQADAVRDLLGFLASPDAAEVKRRHGMAPA